MRIAFLLAWALAVWVAAMSSAAGHSVVERSDLPANATLGAAPPHLTLWFTEPVDPAFSSATVQEQAGRTVSGPAVIARDGRSLTVPLSGATQGVYTVRWRVLSAVDGHTTTGILIFAVGRSLPAGAVRPAGAASPSLVRIGVRWAGYLAAIFLAGSATFSAFVLRPSLRAMPRDDAGPLDAAASRALHRASMVAVGALVTSLAVDLVLQIAALVTDPLATAGGLFWAFLVSTRPGWSAVIQASMVGLILRPGSPRGRILQAAAVIWIILIVGIMTVLGGPSGVIGSSHLALVILAASVYALLGVWMALILPQVPDIRIPELPAVSAAAGGGVLLGIAIVSHATGWGLLPLLGDWLHLSAAALWIGGLASLLVMLHALPTHQQGLAAQAVVPRVSALSGAGLLVLLATGAYAAWLNVPAYQAMAATPYGRTLLIKLLMVLPIIGLGAYNRFVLRPAIARAGQRTGLLLHRFVRTVGAEVAIGTVVLLAAAALTITPPARVTYQAPERPRLILEGKADGIFVRLTLVPVQAGADRIRVAAADPDGRPLGSDVLVRLRMTKLDEDLEPVTVNLSPEADGRHTADGGVLSVDGWWSIDVIVRRKGRLDAMTSFPYGRGPRGTVRPDPRAEDLLARARALAAGFRAWREDEQLSDGRGNVILTRTEFLPPNRLRYHTSVGLEGIIIGSVHYIRTATGEWQRETFSQAPSFEGAVAYLRGARGAILGRRTVCVTEECQVVLWESPDLTTSFAGWIGTTSGRLVRLMMIARSHYMTIDLSDFDRPFQLEPPR